VARARPPTVHRSGGKRHQYRRTRRAHAHSPRRHRRPHPTDRRPEGTRTRRTARHRRTRRLPAHGGHRPHRGQHRPPFHPGQPGDGHRRPGVGHQRLHPRLRWTPPPGRPDRRPARPPPGLRDRRPDLHGRLPPRRHGDHPRPAPHHAGRPRCRLRTGGAHGPRPRHRQLPRRCRPRPGHRHLRRLRWPGRIGRPAPRRRADRRRLVAVDLVDQRARRAGPGLRHAPGPGRRRPPPGPARRRRRPHVDRRSHRAGLRLPPGRRERMERHRHTGPTGRLRRPARRLRPHRAAQPGPADPDAAVPAPGTGRGLRHDDAPGGHGHGQLLLPRPVPAGDQGLQPLRHRPRLPPPHRVVPDPVGPRRPARRPDRAPARPPGRERPRPRRCRLVDPAHRRDRLLGRDPRAPGPAGGGHVRQRRHAHPRRHEGRA
jgi:hypothetical protein